MTPEEIQKRVLFKDSLMLVLDKPAGIAVHTGPSGDTALEKYFNHLQYGLPNPPALAHRLDRDTSGCLVLGRHRKALAKLGKLFSENHIQKKYWAICYGKPPQPQGTIDAALLKVNTQRGWRIIVDNERGQKAVTDYKLLAEKDGICLIEASPLTGRTHQIRIHLKHIGCPIIGDPFYGISRKAHEEIPSRKTLEAEIAETAELMASGAVPKEILHLHARSIAIPIYKSREPIFVEAPPPPHMLKRLKELGYA